MKGSAKVGGGGGGDSDSGGGGDDGDATARGDGDATMQQLTNEGISKSGRWWWRQ